MLSLGNVPYIEICRRAEYLNCVSTLVIIIYEISKITSKRMMMAGNE